MSLFLYSLLSRMIQSASSLLSRARLFLSFFSITNCFKCVRWRKLISGCSTTWQNSWECVSFLLCISNCSHRSSDFKWHLIDLVTPDTLLPSLYTLILSWSWLSSGLSSVVDSLIYRWVGLKDTFKGKGATFATIECIPATRVFSASYM